MMYRATEVIQRLEWLWRIVLVLCAGPVLYWTLDRAPPFALISAQTNSPRPGEVLYVDAQVRRDIHRECTAEFSRYLFDRIGSRHEAQGPQLMTAQSIREMDALAPGVLRVQMQVPLSFPPGPARMVTVLQYRCNPIQDLFRPIGVQMTIPFEVLP